MYLEGHLLDCEVGDNGVDLKAANNMVSQAHEVVSGETYQAANAIGPKGQCGAIATCKDWSVFGR